MVAPARPAAPIKPKPRCDMCRKHSTRVCTRCQLDLCDYHSLVDSNAAIYCDVCIQRVEPVCHDCHRRSDAKCFICPQRLCSRCTATCELVHAPCEQHRYCRDCAKLQLHRCSACRVRVCHSIETGCGVCAASLRLCGDCVRIKARQCVGCLKMTCSKCIGVACNLCRKRRCGNCLPGRTLPRCMAPGCLQPVCHECSIECARCQAVICASHTPAPAGQGACPACQFGYFTIEGY